MSLSDEDRVLQSILVSHVADVLPLMRVHYFLNLFPTRRKEAEYLKNYVDLAGRLPTNADFNRRFKIFQGAPQRPEPLMIAVETLKQALIETVATNGASEMTDLFAKGKIEDFTAKADEMALTIRAIQAPLDDTALTGKAMINEAVAKIQKDATAAMKCIPTGFAPMDRELGGGPRPGMLITLSALINLGKTYVLCRIAENIRAAGFRALIVPLEMAAEDVMNRCIALRYGINADQLIKREKPMNEPRTKEEWYTALLVDIQQKIQSDPCKGETFVRTSVEPVTANLLQSWVRECKADIVLIDAAQDIWDNKKTSNKVERLYTAIAELNGLCRQVPILMTVQLTSDVEKKGITKGNLANIQWAQVFAQKSHCVFTMLGDRGTPDREVTTDKNRDGCVGRKWQITMEFPVPKIEASDLKAVGVTISEEDVFDNADDFDKLTQAATQPPAAPASPNKAPPKRVSISAPPMRYDTDPEPVEAENTPAKTVYQIERDKRANTRLQRAMKRRGKNNGNNAV
jgi:replicative DNA helicase